MDVVPSRELLKVGRVPSKVKIPKSWYTNAHRLVNEAVVYKGDLYKIWNIEDAYKLLDIINTDEHPVFQLSILSKYPYKYAWEQYIGTTRITLYDLLKYEENTIRRTLQPLVLYYREKTQDISYDEVVNTVLAIIAMILFILSFIMSIVLTNTLN